MFGSVLLNRNFFYGSGSGSDFWQVPVSPFLSYGSSSGSSFNKFIVKGDVKKSEKKEIKFKILCCFNFLNSIFFSSGTVINERSGSAKVRNYITVPVPLREKVTRPF